MKREKAMDGEHGSAHMRRMRQYAKWPLVFLSLAAIAVALTLAAKTFYRCLPQEGYLAGLVSGFTSDGILTFLGTVMTVCAAAEMIVQQRKDEQDKQRQLKDFESERLESMQPSLEIDMWESEDGSAWVARLANAASGEFRCLYYYDKMIGATLKPGESVEFALTFDYSNSDIMDDQGRRCLPVLSCKGEGIPDDLFIQGYDEDGNLWAVDIDGASTGRPHVETYVVERGRPLRLDVAL